MRAWDDRGCGTLSGRHLGTYRVSGTSAKVPMGCRVAQSSSALYMFGANSGTSWHPRCDLRERCEVCTAREFRINVGFTQPMRSLLQYLQ